MTPGKPPFGNFQYFCLATLAKALPTHPRSNQHHAMKLILALLAGLALAAYILALADGPNLFDILNNY